ncbi:hypothetical protein vseg_007337 [Gypsophila vaccaria]
MLIYILIEARN